MITVLNMDILILENGKENGDMAAKESAKNATLDSIWTLIMFAKP